MEKLGGELLRPVESPDLALRTSGDGPCEVEKGPGPRSTREDEGVEAFVGGFEVVDIRLEPSHMARLDAVLRGLRSIGGGEFALGDVELALQPVNDGANVREFAR